jgi:hypothetical protein
MAARGSFEERSRQLARAVGDGMLQAEITVDQLYAADQHENTSYRHAPGRTSHYLSKPLLGRADEWMTRLARAAITETGSALRREMREIVEDWTRASEQITPIDENDLPRSHARTVTDDGAPIYVRPAAQRRLTEAELAAKRKRRGWGGRR